MFGRRMVMSIYLPDGIGRHTDLLDRLGPHKTGVGCLYVTDLELVDLAVLEAIVAQSYETLTADTCTHRARDGGSGA